IRRDIVLKYRRDGAQIETNTCEVRLRKTNLHREISLSRADVGEAAVFGPGEIAGDELVGEMADAGHRLQKLAQTSGVGVEGLEERQVAVTHLVLWLASAQGLGKPPPKRIEALICHLEHAADVRGFSPIEEQIGGRSI